MSYGEMATWISWIVSSEMGCVYAWPPGVPVDARPKRSLLTAPSIWIELYRLFFPPTEMAVWVASYACTLT